MKNKNLYFMLSIIIGMVSISGCVSPANKMPIEQRAKFALIESQIGEYGGDMDRRTENNTEMTASVAWINNKLEGGGQEFNLAPGYYDLQVALGCGNTVTCHASKVYSLHAKAGYRYVLKPNEILVSDRNIPREQAKETVLKD